jgi:hypothetical protein
LAWDGAAPEISKNLTSAASSFSGSLPCILINCTEHRYLLTCLTLFHIFIHINNVQINPSKYILKAFYDFQLCNKSRDLFNLFAWLACNAFERLSPITDYLFFLKKYSQKRAIFINPTLMLLYFRLCLWTIILVRWLVWLTMLRTLPLKLDN